VLNNLFIVSFRSLMKRKLFLSVNILGLAIALACCIVGYFCYDFNATFDNIHKNASMIYRVTSWRDFQNERTKHAPVPLALGNAVEQNIRDVKTVIRYTARDANYRASDDLFSIETRFVDPSFFEAFTFNFLQGRGSLADKSSLIISESLSRMLFGDQPAVGKPVDQVLGEGKFKTFIVSGVFEDPHFNTSFSGDAYTNFYNQNFDDDANWNEDSWSYTSGLFVVVPDPSRLAAIAKNINRYVENNNNIRPDFIISEFELDPFIGMGVRDEHEGTRNSYTRLGFPAELIVIVAVIGSFILLITCFNLINTFIAISSARLKEIGIRKVMGGTRKQLFIQFMGETVVLCTTALLLALFIANYLLIPSFNNLWPHLKLTPEYLASPGAFAFMVLLVLFTALLAGTYPAIFISKFHPIEILKGRLAFNRNSITSHSLLVLQFALSLISLICCLAFIDNSRFQSTFDFGFDKSGLIFTEVANRSEFEAYKNALSESPDIISVAGSRHHISSRTYHTPIKSGSDVVDAEVLEVGDDYLETAGMKLVEGRDFANDSESDRIGSVIVSEETVKRFGWDSPLGMEIILRDTIRQTVIGVVKNIYNNGLWAGLEPIVLRKAHRDAMYYIIVSMQPSKLELVNKLMGLKWRELFPDRMYNGNTVDNGLSEATRVNKNIVQMSMFLGIVAMLLTVTGLFTLVSLHINGRMKEIGVRKVLGASAFNLSWVLNKEFAIVIGAACLVGSVAGAFIAQSLISDLWRYYQSITPVTLVSSVVVLLAAAGLSIFNKIHDMVRLNPSDILRNE
jgi:putative ABC transport system permease protein